ncbi:arabinogalactan endo-1,4-beta-galactosidase [Mucilaginibacter sp. RB4R14]|uniref:glycoside hydrolase family 53 protein n=1 Tax=Mucilaginibacter aurantiaciroseus TaxID=2949308 RepID=UPI0020914B12|nr:glycosyl hydrolase 53 family protein [Mucilaginibacter aurantiaciroseus]MCO5936129.1 arabinogalactan endo-1,4-beta-galactosidase [Mucilaginibacter aurantiaciroseus]
MKRQVMLIVCTIFVTSCAVKEMVKVKTVQEVKQIGGVETNLSVSGIAPFFAMGADVGWLSKMEAQGQVFYNKLGVQEDCLQILKEEGINSIRLRAWVNPADGFCGTPDIVRMAVRAKNMGFHLLIDFHYSDSWADPGTQTKPAAWKNHSFPVLLNDVYNYTYHVIDTLKKNGVTPDWVETGNEISNGMLWPDGSTNNFSQLAQLINKGYAAVKAVNPEIKVIVHLDKGDNNGFYVSFFNNLTTYGGNFDIIGMSCYPYWSNTTFSAYDPLLTSNMNDMVRRYGKPVIIAEIGNDSTKPQETYYGVNDVINRVSRVGNAQGLGVFYWEPEGYFSWSGYQLSCWDNTTKRPTLGMDAFLYNPANNLMSNQDFEAAGAQSGTITNWTLWSNNNYDAIYTESGGYTGYYRLTHWKSTAYQASTFQNFTNITNGTYKLTAWVLNGGGQKTCQLYAKNFGNTEIDAPLPVTNSWTQIVIDNIQVTNNSLEVGLWSDANAGNWCSMDNVYLQKK